MLHNLIVSLFLPNEFSFLFLFIIHYYTDSVDKDYHATRVQAVYLFHNKIYYKSDNK